MKESCTLKDREEFCGNDNERLEENILILQNELLWNSYCIKPALVKDEAGKVVNSELPIRDRIVQIAIHNVVSGGNITDKGVKRLMRQFKSFS